MFERKVVANPQFGQKAGSLLDKYKKAVGAKPTENSLDKESLIYGHALSQESFACIYDSYFPRLYNYLACRVNSREEAEDLVAFVFEQLLNKFQTFDPQRGNLDGWIFTIARNALTDRLRYKRRHHSQTLDEQIEIEADISLSDQFLKQEEIEQLRKYLVRLSDRERELLALRYGAGLSHRRIGEMMKMNEGSVAVTLGRTLRKLYRYFEADGVKDL